MEEPNQSYEQRQERRKWEFSKKLALINVISYLVLMVACLVGIILTVGNEAYLKEIMTVLTTSQIAFQGLYFGKAGVENLQRLKSIAKETPVQTYEDELG